MRNPPTTVKAAHLRTTCQSGQATVEFALVLPLLLVFIFGIAQFGLSLNAASNQTSIASVVARYATVDENPGAGTLQQWGKAKAAAESQLNGAAQVCIAFPNGTEVGNPVEVTVKSTTNWLPILQLAATSTEIKDTASMRLEAAPEKIAAGCA